MPCKTEKEKILLKVTFCLMALFAGLYCVFSVTELFQFPLNGIFAKGKNILAFVVILLEILCVFYFGFVHDEKKQNIKEILKQFCSTEIILLFILFGLFLLSCGYYFKTTGDATYVRNNLGFITETVFQLFILFPFGICLVGKTKTKAFEWIMHIVLFLIALFELYLIYRLFVDPQITENIQIGYNIPPVINNRFSIHFQNGDYINPNTIAIWAYCITFLSAAMMFISESKLKILSIFETIIGFVWVTICGARAGIVGIGLTFGFLLSIYLFRKSFSVGKKIISIILGILLAAIFIFGLNYGAGVIEYAVTKNFSSSSYSIVTTTNLSDSADESSIQIRSLADSNSRIDIWKGASKVLFNDKKSFIFGSTFFLVPDQIYKTHVIDSKLHAHNQILEIGVAWGVPAMVIFIILIIVLVINSIRILIYDDHFEYLLPSFGLCLLLIANMFESGLIGLTFLCGPLFFIFMGMVAYRARLVSLKHGKAKWLINAPEWFGSFFAIILLLALYTAVLIQVLF